MGMFKQRTVWPCILGYMIWDHIVNLLRVKGFQLGMELQVSKKRDWALQSQSGFGGTRKISLKIYIEM